MILYDFDSNATLVEATKNWTLHELTRAYKTLHGRLLSFGLTFKYYKQDNESHPAMKECIDKQIEYQLVLPHQHLRNLVERAIRNFKNHYIVGLYSTNE